MAFTEKLIERYGENKKREKELKKEIERDNKAIKSHLEAFGTDRYESDNYTVTVHKRERTDFNELQGIEILRAALSKEEFSKVVKTKEYIDQDALESAIYAKQVPANILVPATTPLDPIITLNIKEKL